MDTTSPADVIIVGSGIAGLVTALTAAELGLRVRILEKSSLIGGTTAYSEAMIWVPCSTTALKAGCEDSPEAAITYLLAAGGDTTDRGLADAYVRTAPDALAFLEGHTAVRYQLTRSSIDYEMDLPGATQGVRALSPLPFDGRRLGRRFARLRAPLMTTTIFGGMSVSGPNLRHFYRVGRSIVSTGIVAGLFMRYLWDRLGGFHRGTLLTGGNGVIAGLVLALAERGVEIEVDMAVHELLLDGSRVAGVRAEHRGRTGELLAQRAVVLACGGFSRDLARTARLFPHVAAGKSHFSTAPADNTGDGIALGEHVGGEFVSRLLQPAAWAPVSLVPFAAGAVPFPHFGDRCKPGLIAVDRRGRRFVNEATSYHRFVPAMIAACCDDPQVEVFLLADHRAQRRYGLGAAPPFPGRLARHLKSGYLLAGDSIESLATRSGIDPTGLKATIERFNADAARGQDSEFDKGGNAYNRSHGDPTQIPNPCVAPLLKPPFYAVKMVPGDLGTFAGLHTDTDARVLDTSGRAIEGLYAVGNDMASVMGGAYPGAGIVVGSAVTFGYRAARHASHTARDGDTEASQ